MTTIKLQTALRLIRFNHDDPEVRNILQTTIDELDRLYKVEAQLQEVSQKQPTVTKEPKVGTRATCEACNLPIVYVGPYWDHATGEAKPRHPAWPKEGGDTTTNG